MAEAIRPMEASRVRVSLDRSAVCMAQAHRTIFYGARAIALPREPTGQETRVAARQALGACIQSSSEGVDAVRIVEGVSRMSI